MPATLPPFDPVLFKWIKERRLGTTGPGQGNWVRRRKRKTFTEVLADMPELKGTYLLTVDGPSELAIYDPVSGAGSVSRVDVTNQSRVDILLPRDKTYYVDISAVSGDLLNIRDGNGGTNLATIPVSTRFRNRLTLPNNNLRIQLGGNPSAASFVVNSIKEIPAGA